MPEDLSYLFEDQAPQEPITQEAIPQEQPPDLSYMFEQQPAQPQQAAESYLGAGLRNIVRTGADVTAGAGGVPRNIQSILGSIQDIYKPTQEEYAEEIKGLSPEMQDIHMQMHAEGGKPFVQLPTSETIRETIGKPLPEEYLKPRGNIEKFVSNTAEEVGAFLFPIGGEAISATKVLKATAGVLGGDVGEFLAKKIGLPEWAQKVAKVGTMILTAAGLEKGLKSRAISAYDTTENIGKKTNIIEKPIKSIVKDFQKDVIHGTSGSVRRTLEEGLNDLGIASKQELKRAAKALQKQYAKNLQELPFKKAMQLVERSQKVNLRQIVRFKKTLNTVYDELPGSNSAELSKIYKNINTFLKKSKVPPKGFGDMLETADEIWTGISHAKKMNKWITSKLSQSLKLSPLAYFFNPALTAKTGAAIGTGAAVGYPSVFAYNTLKNIITLPKVRNIYANIFAAAGRKNTPSMLRHAGKLLEVIKEQPEQQQ